jgi:hypothetical protein
MMAEKLRLNSPAPHEEDARERAGEHDEARLQAVPSPPWRRASRLFLEREPPGSPGRS